MTRIGGTEVLPAKVKEQLFKSIKTDDKVLFCIASGDIQATVALQNRVLIIQAPNVLKFLSYLGLEYSRVTDFYYKDITAIEAGKTFFMFMMMDYIKISAPGYESRITKPSDAPNCMLLHQPLPSNLFQYIDKLRQLIVESKTQPTMPHRDSVAVGTELEKLAALKQRGILSEEEFQQAKKKLLDGGI